MSGRPVVTGVKVRRVARGESSAAWEAHVREQFWTDSDEGSALKRDASGWVLRVSLAGEVGVRVVVVKGRRIGSGWRGWLSRAKSALGRSRGDRAWRGAGLLSSKGIAAGRPLWLGEVVIDNMWFELLILDWVEGPTLLEVMRAIKSPGVDGMAMKVRAQHRLATEVGATVSAISAAGLFNRDHKPSNLVVRETRNSESKDVSYGVTVIDCVGVRPWTLWPMPKRMLASLVIEPTGCGVHPRRALMMRVVWTLAEFMLNQGTDDEPDRRRAAARATRRVIWRETAEVVVRHGDPRPRTDPLAGHHD